MLIIVIETFLFHLATFLIVIIHVMSLYICGWHVKTLVVKMKTFYICGQHVMTLVVIFTFMVDMLWHLRAFLHLWLMCCYIWGHFYIRGWRVVTFEGNFYICGWRVETFEGIWGHFYISGRFLHLRAQQGGGRGAFFLTPRQAPMLCL